MALSSSLGTKTIGITTSLPIGTPMAVPLGQDVPLGYLECPETSGATFLAANYPELYVALGSNLLPDFKHTSTHFFVVKACETIEMVDALKQYTAVYVPTYPVGTPFPWVSPEARPAGTLICNGDSFSTTEYPELAKVFPSGILPDIRGLALRGRDAGKGLDVDGASRAVGSYQADQYKSHVHDVKTYIGGSGSAVGNNGAEALYTISGATAMLASGGTETRMKNMACDWLVYAKTMVYDLTINNGNATTLEGYAASHFLAESDLLDRLKVKLNASGLAPMGVCRARVTFDGTTAAPTILSSMNVSSITDNGTGDFTLNFTTPLPTDSYTVVGSAMRNTANIISVSIRGATAKSSSMTTSSVRVDVRENGNTLLDPLVACISIFC